MNGDIFKIGKHGNDLSSSEGSRIKPQWSDLACEVGMGSGTNTHAMFDTVHRANSSTDLCAKSYTVFIVSHTHCVLVSFIVNDYVERTEVTCIV